MADIVKALKTLGKKFNSSATEPSGTTIAEVLESTAGIFNIKGDKGDKGDTGATGAYVTAIALTTTEGAVTGGTATLSDGSTVSITVTAAT